MCIVGESTQAPKILRIPEADPVFSLPEGLFPLASIITIFHVFGCESKELAYFLIKNNLPNSPMPSLSTLLTQI